jgi:tetratricopeptide (TPR) repeat protein
MPAAQIAEIRGDLAMRRRDPRAAAGFFARARTGGERAGLDRKLGKALAAGGDLAGAEAAFRAAGAHAGTPDEKEGAAADLALFYQFAGREPDARRVLVQATGELPGSAVLWAMRGAAEGRAGDVDAAYRAYERSVSLRPSPVACKTLAALAFERRDRARAVALWKQSLALDPDQPDVRAFLRRFGSGY